MITPQIGMEGYWQLMAPWAALLHPTTIYRCTAVRSISELVQSQIDPFTTFYQPNGLDITVYNSDVAQDVRMVTLLGTDGHVLYVPTTYINTYPLVDGVKYVVRGLTVELSALPINTDLTALKQKISDMVKAFTGAPGTVHELALSKPTVIDYPTAANLEATRQANITANETDYAAVLRLTAQLAAVQTQLNLVSTAFANYRQTHP